MDGALGTSTGNMQFNFQHYPQSAANQSFFTATRPPSHISIPGNTITTTSGGSTVTINGYNFTTNALAGALIVITDSAGTFIETQTIASNTATVVTITDTWLATTTGGTFVIYVPCYMGSAQTIFQRFYTQEGVAGGIRYGVGVTNDGQNGLSYMDATGDFYWRDKGGTSIKLNTGATTTIPSSRSITRDMTAESGEVTTAHGLGRIPDYVRITGFCVSGSGMTLSSIGTYETAGNSNKAIYFSNVAGTPTPKSTTNAIALVPLDATNYQYASITVDITNITLTWSKVGSPTGTAYIIMEAS